jgi:hypothetical protein
MARTKTSVAGIPGKDPTLPKVSVTINNEVYYLAYDFNGIAIAEEITGLDLLNSSMDLSKVNARKFRALLFASMLKARPEITLFEVGDLIRNTTMNDLVIALVEAWTGSRPTILDEKDVDANPPVEQPSV